MACSDSTSSLRQASRARGQTSVIVLDVMKRTRVSTTSSEYELIELTDESVEDLALMIDDIMVTASAVDITNLNFQITLQTRALNTSWEDVGSSPDLLTAAGETTTGLKIGGPWANRGYMGRKFRLVLKIKSTSGTASADMTVSIALRLLT